MIPDLPHHYPQIKGFLADDEGEALYRHASLAASYGPLLEVGSYCGKSTICLGLGARRSQGTVYAVDHHRGSEEHQAGEMFHDPELYDPSEQQMDTLGEFRRNIYLAGLDDTVVPIVSASATAARHWQTPLAMVFIDGGHSLDSALIDYRCWAPQLMAGAVLAIHDLFPRAAEGGQAPWTIYRLALQSGLFEEIERINTLGVLRRL